MRFLAIALLVLASVAAVQPEAVKNYLASRDAYIARFTADTDAGDFGDDVMAAHDAALDDLEAQLKQIVGPVALQGFPADGAISLDTLFDTDVGFGSLDGLLFSADDMEAGALVTTDALVEVWLAAHRDWWDTFTMPDNLPDALREESFYIQAISADAAVVRFAELPVTVPTGADHVYAMLDMRTQDLAVGVPDEIMVAVIGGGKFYLATAPVTAPVHAIPACDAVWKGYEARAEAQTGSDTDDPYALYAEGEEAYRRCYAEHAPGEDAYPAVVAEAQALADRLH